MRKLRFKTLLLGLSLALLAPLSALADVEVNEQNFPDANFRKYVSSNYATKGVIATEVLMRTENMDVMSLGISSLEGIAHFKWLKSLLCSGNQLTSLDLSKNTALQLLLCQDNKLTSLDVSGCTALTYLACPNNQLTTLDVSQNTALTNLYCRSNQLTSLDVSKNTALTYLYCYDNQLISLDVSGCTKMEVLECHNNQLMSLNMSGCRPRTYFYCYNNRLYGENMDKFIASLPNNSFGTETIYIYDSTSEKEGNVCTKAQVAAIKAKGWMPYYYNGTDRFRYEGSEDVPHTIAINEHNFPDTYFRNWLLKQNYGKDGVITDEEIAGITEIYFNDEYSYSLMGIQYFKALTRLDCSNNSLRILNVSMNTALTYLRCNNNRLMNLDVSKNTALKELHCYANQLTALDVSKNTALTNLDCSNNQLTSLNVSGCTALTTLWCFNNQLTALDVSKNTALKILYCYNTQLTALDVSKKTALTNLDCTNNQLTSLNVSGCTALTAFWCFNNQLTALDVSKNTALSDFRCDRNQLASLDVSGCTALTTLYCHANQLTSLDVSKNTALTILYCYDNQLASLDVSKNTALTILYCYDNQLTSLDVSKNTALTRLECFNNQLTNLDVSACTNLSIIDISENKIYGENMYKLISSLPNTGGKIWIYNSTSKTEGNICTKEQVAAIKAKGWTPLYYNGTDWLEYEGGEYMQDIAINERNFPDKNFRNWLLKQNYGKDGVITNKEIAQVTSINVNSQQISTLEGIQYFTALTYLYCNSNQLTSLDVSNNNALKELYCRSNQLTALDVSKNTALTILYCYDNQLTALDVSKNTALTRLECYTNQLTALDLSGCTDLSRIDISENKIYGENMDKLISSLPNTRGTIWIYNNTLYREGNICTKSQVAAIKEKEWMPLYYNGTDWFEYEGSELPPIAIDEQNFPDKNFRNWLLEQDYGKDGAITSKEIAQVTSINVSNKQISTLEGIQYFTALTSLYCYDNQLTSLDVSNNTALTSLDCHTNQLTSLDVSNNTALTYLVCHDNQLTALDVSKNTKLEYLHCYSNQLTALDVSNHAALRFLYCYDNQLTSLNVYGCISVSYLYCYNNQLYGENMDKFIASLPIVYDSKIYLVYNSSYEKNACTKEQVAVIKEKGWTPFYYNGTKWEEYEGSEVPRIAIDEQNFPDKNFRNWLLEQGYGKDGAITDEEIAGITSINVSSKQISTLEGIQYFTALKELYCSSNRLTSLDVSGCIALERLECNDNQLTTLDVSGCTALTRLECYNNQLYGENMDKFIASLPVVYDSKIYLLIDNSSYEKNACTKEQVAVIKEKGWTPYKFNYSWVEYEGSDDLDGIIATEADNGSEFDTNAPAYDLNGRRVENWQSTPGIYIINGKKIMAK